MEIEKIKHEGSLKTEGSSNEIEERKKKIMSFAKNKINWITYIFLGLILILNVYIRTRNIPKLKDITTGTWTLGPDLDPFLFLRWAEYIVAHGTLMAHDAMRYVPVGYDTAGEMKLLSYMIAWFYYPVSWITGEQSVTYAAILFPVFMSILTTIAFFLLAKKIFQNEKKWVKNSIALLSSLFFVLMPSLLPRTIAGIPEKESAAFFFMFMAFYLFLEAMTAEKTRNKFIFAILSGLFTAGMALIWGGFIFVFFTIPLAFLINCLIKKISKKEPIIYGIWLLSSFLFMMPFSTRYNLLNLIMSLSTGVGVAVFLITVSMYFLSEKKLFIKFNNKLNIPEQFFYFLISGIILIILVALILGPNLLLEQLNEVKSSLVTPITDRFGMTVAENKQPYFDSDWMSEFGPIKFGIPLYFWMFFVGAVMLFYFLIEHFNKKEKILLTGSYFIFLFALIFSRYSPSSILNGTNWTSILFQFGGWILFLGTASYVYNRRFRKKDTRIFESLNFSYIVYFVVFTIALVGARGGIRLIMVLGAVSPIAVSFFTVKLSEKYFENKGDLSKILFGIILLVVLLSVIFTAWTYYQQEKYTAENYAPSGYSYQWQNAMAWVRDNTPENAVFAHWWDYGYWLQSIGKRATILDGGNSMGCWDHQMGRYVLTESDQKKSIDYLYSHNGTHLLIDSTDIGKYTAFSSIGADVNYDRFSWIPAFSFDDKQTIETNNKTIYFYSGGSTNDEDIVIKKDGKDFLIPRKISFVAGIITQFSMNEIEQPEAVFIYNGEQYREKLRYLYYKNKLYDFKDGLNAGIFIFPSITSNPDGTMAVNERGTLLYLSPRTIDTNLVRLYLFNQNSQYFKLVHTESSMLVNDIKKQKPDMGEFVYYGGVQGPIRIWEVKYPAGMKANPEYVSTECPEDVEISKKGEYN